MVPPVTFHGGPLDGASVDPSSSPDVHEPGVYVPDGLSWVYATGYELVPLRPEQVRPAVASGEHLRRRSRR